MLLYYHHQPPPPRIHIYVNSNAISFHVEMFCPAQNRTCSNETDKYFLKQFKQMPIECDKCPIILRHQYCYAQCAQLAFLQEGSSLCRYCILYIIRNTYVNNMVFSIEWSLY